MTQSMAAQYIRHGLTPFFRLPLACLSGSEAALYLGADAVILGAPWDAGVTYRPGARFAPYEVRRVSALFQSFHPSHRLDVFRALSVVAGGNVVMPPFDANAARELLRGEVSRVVTAGAVPFLVGGDHSITLPALRAIAAQHGPVSLVHLDAHLDTSTAEVWGEPFHHGTPIRHAIEEGLVAEGQLFQVGIRATRGHPEEDALVQRHGGRVFSPELMDELGTVEVVDTIRRAVGDRPLYLSLDVDGLDPSFAPGTGTPVVGGLSSREVLQLLRGLAGVRVVGLDVVEICPGLDHADVTAHLGAQLLYEGLALLALQRRG